jgi:hypothetical protein
MPLNRLRRILQNDYSVRLDSSDSTVWRVQAQIAARSIEFQNKRKQPPLCKPPASVPLVANTPRLIIRAIDLLRKIGELSTPSWANMATLSASWATRRYFWAIAEPTGPGVPMRLNDEVAELDFHQKTLLSDEFGVGMAGLVVERLFRAGQFIDVSVALRDPVLYQDIRAASSAQPDYLMWSAQAGSPYFVVECKGSQTTLSTTMGQLRRGMEQVPSLVFGAGARQVTTLVIATLLRKSGAIVYVLDPPDPPEKEEEPHSERIDKRTWRITDAERFVRRSWGGRRSQLLRWAGQFESAARIDAELAFRPVAVGSLPNQDLERRVLSGVPFLGRSTPLFPELGEPALQTFTGVFEDLLHAALEAPDDAERIAADAEPRLAEGEEGVAAGRREGHVSIGSDGTCLVVEGLF